jgi:lauroyl/myristoyl acyltransferase
LVRWLRWLEGWLPPTALGLLLWPVAAVAATRAFFDARCLAGFEGLPPSLRGRSTRSTWPWRLWYWCTQANLQVFLRLWPDRLRTRRWQARCHWVGRERLKRCLRTGQPVILAFAHFGPIHVLTHWLRASGIPAAILVQAPAHRGPVRHRLARLADEANGLCDVPQILTTANLRQVVEFLKPRRLLLMAVDVNRGRESTVRGDDFCMRMATGPVRLAARVNAAVLPCVIRGEGLFRFTIELGPPVPAEWLADPRQAGAACKHLAASLVSALRANPEQLSLPHLPHFN